MFVQEPTSVLGIGKTHVGEHGERFAPVVTGGVGLAGLVQGAAKDDQGGGFAGAMAGFTVDGQRLPAEVDRLVRLVAGLVEVGQGGEGLSFDQPVAGQAGQGERLLGAAPGLVGLAEALLGGGQADEGLALWVAAVVQPGKLQRLLILADRQLGLAEP